MHSVYKQRWLEQQKQKEEETRRKLEPSKFKKAKPHNDALSQGSSPLTTPRPRTAENRTEPRDQWLVEEPLIHNPIHHKFRDRVPILELGTGSVTSTKYESERNRIERHVETESFEGVHYSTTWANHSGGYTVLFGNGDRARQKEIQRHMIWKHRSEKERIELSLQALSPLPYPLPISPRPNDASSRISSPLSPRSPGRSAISSAASGILHFRYRRAPEHHNPFIPIGGAGEPPMQTFGVRRKDKEIGHNEFRSIVPGYLPDSIRGKWMTRKMSPGYQGWEAETKAYKESPREVQRLFADNRRLRGSLSTTLQPFTPETVKVHERREGEMLSLEHKQLESPRTHWLNEQVAAQHQSEGGE